MNSDEFDGSSYDPFVRGQHFRLFVLSLALALFLAMAVVVGLAAAFSLLLP